VHFHKQVVAVAAHRRTFRLLLEDTEHAAGTRGTQPEEDILARSNPDTVDTVLLQKAALMQNPPRVVGRLRKHQRSAAGLHRKELPRLVDIHTADIQVLHQEE
jgi:hypothetical protein